MSYGTPEYYRNKLAVMRESLLRDTLDQKAIKIQEDLDRVRDSTKTMEDKLDSLDEEIWRLKRELTRSQIENSAKQEEINRLRKANKEILWSNFELEMENASLTNCVRIYKDAADSAKRKSKVVSSPPWRY